MSQRGRTSTFKVENFSDGLNTRFANTEIKASESPDLLNVQFDFKGEIRKRNGYEKATASGIGSGTAALDQFIYIQNGGTQKHLVASDTDVNEKESPDGAAWSSIKTLSANSIGDSTTQFDITNPGGDIFRYTWDTTGTDPEIGSNVVSGKSIIINAQNFNAANNGTFTVVSVGTDYFEVENASGVAETNVTIGTGSITIPSAGERWSFLQIDDLVYAGNGINDWFKYDGETVTDVTTIPHGNISTYWQEKVWVVNSTNPSQVSHSITNSALGDVETFTGGDSGFIILGKDDGQKITEIRPFGNQLIVFKERSTYRIYYNESASAYAQELVDPVFGCISKDAAVNVQNDIFFFTGKEVRRLGFDASYFEQIRTSAISENIEDQLDSLTNEENSFCAFDEDKFYLAVSKGSSTVDTVFVLDTRYKGWMKWDSLDINGFLYDQKNSRLYWSSASTDRVYLFNDSFSDDGSAISALWTSKRFDLDDPTMYKRFRWLHLVSRNVTGDITVLTEILNNQSVYKTEPKTFPIGQTTPEGVWGAYIYGEDLWGGSVDTVDDPELIYNRISLGGPRGISVRFLFSNNNLDEDLSIQSISLIFSMKDPRFYPSGFTR